MFEAKEYINPGMLPQQTSQIYIYTSLFKRERQYDTFKTKANINQEILPQQKASQICMYSSFFKREQQYDTFKRKKLSIERYCHINKRRARYTCILLSDNMTCLKRKKLSIKRYCHNKGRARYACIPRSLSVSDNMTRLSERKYQLKGFLQKGRILLF